LKRFPGRRTDYASAVWAGMWVSSATVRCYPGCRPRHPLLSVSHACLTASPTSVWTNRNGGTAVPPERARSEPVGLPLAKKE
jgi:hypothetical protein